MRVTTKNDIYTHKKKKKRLITISSEFMVDVHW